MRFKITVVILLLAITIGVCGVGVYTSFISNDAKEAEKADEVDYSMKIMSFNVRTLNLEFGRHPNDDVVIRAPLIIKQIEEEGPDLIGCQEWTAVHEANIVKEIEDIYGYISANRDGSIIGEMGAIFYKRDRFELIEASTFWLSETPDKISMGWDAACNRICTTAIFKDLKTNQIIQFSNTHLDHRGALARENSTKMVVKNVTDSQYPAILVGDFNYDVEDINYQYCIENLDDTRLLADGATTMITYHAWNETYITNATGLPIDYIMLKKDTFNVSSYNVLNKLVDGLFASDHFAVVAVIEVK